MRWPGIDQPMHIQSAFVDLFAITNTPDRIDAARALRNPLHP